MMRITKSMAASHYLTGLQKTYSQLNKYSNQIQTGMRITRISEDPSSAIRAIQAQRKMNQNETHIYNAKSATSLYQTAEDFARQMSDVNNSVSSLFIQAINGDKGTDEREAAINELEVLRDELLTLMNGQHSTRYIFGGSNGTRTPFTVDDNGDLFYNGHKVADIPTYSAADMEKYFGKAAYVDIGFGLTIDGQDVNPNTAFQISFNGLDFLGSGDNNLYLMINEMITELRQEPLDADACGDLLEKYKAQAAAANVQVTRIGAGTKQLESTVDRLESEQINLTERISSLVGVDSEEAILNLKMQEYVYNAALYLGQRLLQPTLFNFMS